MAPATIIRSLALAITRFDFSHLPFWPNALGTQSLELALGPPENKLDAGLHAQKSCVHTGLNDSLC